MLERPFRTGTTWLTDDQLVLLDVLFDRGATFRLLRQKNFHKQWNLGYVHDLDDAALESNLRLLCDREVLSIWRNVRGVSFRMTHNGGKLWSHERCPDWNRYCSEQYKIISRDRTLMTVMAVSSDVRDHFLTLWPEYPARRKKAVIRDFPMIEWHPFPQLYIGLATYDERRRWSLEEYVGHVDEFLEHLALVDRERSWWRNVPELQRFVPDL